jgi:DNA-binding CsgD family transcriptional regulator
VSSPVYIRIATDDQFVADALKQLITEHIATPTIFIPPDPPLRPPTLIIRPERRSLLPTPAPAEDTGTIAIWLRRNTHHQRHVMHRCAMNGLCIFHDDSVDTILLTIKQALKTLSSPTTLTGQRCQRCEHIKLTRTEKTVLILFFQGFTLTQIGYIIQRSLKTVSSKKRSVMRKLNISTDCELHRFFT